MPKFAANLSFLYTELPLLDRIGAAAKSGFRGVEFMSPYEEKASDIAARLRDHGQTQVLFNLPSGNWAGGERGIAILPDRVKEFRANVPRAIDYAQALGCAQVNCLA
jgi:hydroxypyruvate isomerase